MKIVIVVLGDERKKERFLAAPNPSFFNRMEQKKKKLYLSRSFLYFDRKSKIATGCEVLNTLYDISGRGYPMFGTPAKNRRLTAQDKWRIS